MALQTTGLEFFYLSVDFSENDKILLVEQEFGLHCLYCIYWHVFTTKDVFAVGERIGVCLFYSQIVRRMYGRLCTASSGCTVGTWIF